MRGLSWARKVTAHMRKQLAMERMIEERQSLV
jgi:hypothetical protein